MILSKRGYWALRALLYLATQTDSRRLHLAADIADAIGAPPHSTADILRRLSLAGLTLSQRGAGGGFALARSPQEITPADVLAALGDDLWEPSRFPPAPFTTALDRFLALRAEEVISAMRDSTLVDLLDSPS